MNLKRLLFGLCFTLVLARPARHAQRSDADQKLLSELRAEAEKGDAQSQLDLSMAIFFGNLDLAKDEVEAVKWCRKAAEQNLAEAQYLLGACSEKSLFNSSDETLLGR